MDVTTLAATALTIGLLGGVHCAGMCGGIAGALSLALPPERRNPATLWGHQVAYGIGRITSYGVAGAFVGSLGVVVADIVGPSGAFALRTVAAALLLLIGLQLGGWWSGVVVLERFGAAVWRWMAPGVGPLARDVSLLRAIGVGAAWGWLPCGLVYSTLAWSAASADPIDATIAMLCFGLGTLPAVMLSGVAAARFSSFVRRPDSRKTAAVLVIALAIWTLFSARTLIRDDESACGHAQHSDVSSHTVADRPL